MVLWPLSDVPHSTPTAPPRIGHRTRSGKEESLWSFGEKFIEKARSDTRSARSHEVNGDLISPIVRLVHLELVAQMPGVINSAGIFVAKHLVLDSALVVSLFLRLSVSGLLKDSNVSSSDPSKGGSLARSGRNSSSKRSSR